MNVWCVRAKYGIHAEKFCQKGFVGLDFGIDEPYPTDKGRKAFTNLYLKYHPEKADNLLMSRKVEQLMRFCEIEVGDYVITPCERRDQLFYGVVAGLYYFEPQPVDGGSCRHRRKVRWGKAPVFSRTLSLTSRKALSCQDRIFQILWTVEFLDIMAAWSHEPPQPTQPTRL